ncbi:hypothetical protein CYMTET_26399, partial [Cymbomonas tetramitiformis]
MAAKAFAWPFQQRPNTALNETKTASRNKRQRLARIESRLRPACRLLCKAVQDPSGTEAREWYFAYGVDANCFALDRWGVQPYKVTSAAVRGYELRFRSPGLHETFEPAFADLEKVADRNQLVHGALLEVAPEDLSRLLEGEVGSGRARTQQDVQVVTYDGRVVEGITFVTKQEEHSQDFRPSSRYLEVLVEGARLRGLDPVYIRPGVKHGLGWNRWLEECSCQSLTVEQLLPAIPRALAAQPISDDELFHAASTYMAVGGFVFDVADGPPAAADSVGSGFE